MFSSLKSPKLLKVLVSFGINEIYVSKLTELASSRQNGLKAYGHLSLCIIINEIYLDVIALFNQNLKGRKLSRAGPNWYEDAYLLFMTKLPYCYVITLIILIIIIIVIFVCVR